MKTWKDLSTVNTPPGVSALPKDGRGYPIPWIAAYGADGKVDFTILDESKRALAIVTRLCPICGSPLGDKVAFVGGPMSMDNMAFVDPAMHKECAEYALQVCPFLAAPKFSYQRKSKALAGMTIKSLPVSNARPEVFGLGVASSYFVTVTGDGMLAVATQWESVEWWCMGERVQGHGT